MTSTTGVITDFNDLDPVERWAAEVEAAEKELKKAWERGEMANKRFIDDRDVITSDRKWFNIFYANTNILESALYAQLPKPTVSRKYIDYNDDVARVAAEILQRSITEDLDDPEDTTDAVMRHCVQDRLVPGLAAAWLRLETHTEPISLPSTPGQMESETIEELSEKPQGVLGEDASQITDQEVCVDYVFWKDFLWSPCRVWEERRWVGRKVYLMREELIKRFGDTIGREVPLNFTVVSARGDNLNSTPKEDVLKKAIVYEIWDRTQRKIVWYVKGYPKLLDEKDDFLGLKGFEPCPRPMLANTSTSNTVFRPDYYMIQDQYSELDTINNRISMLIQACKVIGVYDKSAIGIGRMLTEGFDNQLIPVDNWAMFAEKGGLKGQIDWLPLESVVTALNQLGVAREAIKGQIYELTGIADIVRGASKASETLGAQQIKAQFASVRIKKLQDEVARFASDIMRIKAEIMVKHFEPQILVQKSNILATGEQKLIGPALALLKSEEGFEWRIQVNADTLSQADYAAEKTDRTEFMSMMTKFMAQFGPMVQSAPASVPLLLTMLKWAVAGFRNARDIEGIIDKELDRMIKEASMPKPQKPDPEMLKLQAEQKMAQEEHQMEMQSKQMQIMIDKQNAAMEMQQSQMEIALERQRLEMEMAMEQQRQQQQLQFEMLMNAMKLQSEQEMASVKLESANEQARIKAKTAAAGSGKPN